MRADGVMMVFNRIVITVAPDAADNQEAKPMARKPNYEFERRERERLKAIKNAEKAAAKKEAKERAKAEAGTAAPREVEPDQNS
jgi:hypothetical protein